VYLYSAFIVATTLKAHLMYVLWDVLCRNVLKKLVFRWCLVVTWVLLVFTSNGQALRRLRCFTSPSLL